MRHACGKPFSSTFRPCSFTQERFLGLNRSRAVSIPKYCSVDYRQDQFQDSIQQAAFKRRVTENRAHNQTLHRAIVCITNLLLTSRDKHDIAAVYATHKVYTCLQQVPTVCLPSSNRFKNITHLMANLNDPSYPSTSNLQWNCLYQHWKRYSPHPMDLRNHCHS